MNITEFSKQILQRFPRIVEFELITPFGVGTPLSDWSVKNNKVTGIEWWKAYNALKHNKKDSYAQATLDNACSSLSALYILNLYLIHDRFGSLRIVSDNPNVYFKCKYLPEYVFAGEGALPDFGGFSPVEKLRNDHPELFANNSFSG